MSDYCRSYIPFPANLEDELLQTPEEITAWIADNENAYHTIKKCEDDID